jgi:predicted HAD superfamily Cof-like phosphohydrolase
MKKSLSYVSEFHTKFKVPQNHTPTAQLPLPTVELRHRLMAEENDEYLDAAKSGNLTEIADALGDQLYILCGTILSHGLQNVIEDVFEEIQQSNLSKLDENGEPIFREDGKIMKSNRYFKPNISAVLEKHLKD